jgi:hypothetical protein
MGLRPIIIKPPYSIADAKSIIVGTWNGSEGIGHYEVREEIDFHQGHTYTLRVENADRGWDEVNGYYDIDTIRDSRTNDLHYAVSFSTSLRGGGMYFKGGNKLYAAKGNAEITKNWGLFGGLLWLLVVPCLIGYFPTKFLWRKVNQW